eukprot:Opistho-2@52440
MQRLLAPIAAPDASPAASSLFVLRFLTSSSHAFASHQGASTRFFPSRAGTNSFHSLMIFVCAFLSADAFANMSLCIVSRDSLTDATSDARGIVLFAPVSRDGNNLAVAHVLGADFDANGDALELPVVVLPSRGVVLAEISTHAHATCLQARECCITRLVHLLPVGIGSADSNSAWNDNDLYARHTRRQHKPLVVSVDHHHHTNGARGEAPRVLPDMALASVLLGRVRKRNVEHFAEVLTETMARGALDAATGGGHKSLHSGCVETASKLFLLALAALDDGHGEQGLVHLRIQLKNLQHFHIGLGLCGKGSVALLPEELARADKGRRVLELPPHDIAPLIELEREVPVRLNPLSI